MGSQDSLQIVNVKVSPPGVILQIAENNSQSNVDLQRQTALNLRRSTLEKYPSNGFTFWIHALLYTQKMLPLIKKRFDTNYQIRIRVKEGKKRFTIDVPCTKRDYNNLEKIYRQAYPPG